MILQLYDPATIWSCNYMILQLYDPATIWSCNYMILQLYVLIGFILYEDSTSL
jgi:hypothetical protein